MLIILIGRSGAGKSTFIKAMDCPENFYEISSPIKRELRQKGLPICHGTVQPILHERYTRDPLWQIPYILEALKNKRFLLIDGPRSLPEVQRLIKLFTDTLIVRIEASAALRSQRLQIRDGDNLEAFQRIEFDESHITGLEEIFNLTDFIIENNGSLDKLRDTARKFRAWLER